MTIVDFLIALKAACKEWKCDSLSNGSIYIVQFNGEI